MISENVHRLFSNYACEKMPDGHKERVMVARRFCEGLKAIYKTIDNIPDEVEFCEACINIGLYNKNDIKRGHFFLAPVYFHSDQKRCARCECILWLRCKSVDANLCDWCYIATE